MIGLFFFALTSKNVFAETEYTSHVESSELSELSAQISAAIKLRESKTSYFQRCDFIGKKIDLNAGVITYFVTTKDACGWGAALGPIWIIQETKDEAQVILSTGAYGMKIQSNRRHGFPDLKFTSGTAGLIEEEYWTFDGKKYLLKSETSTVPGHDR